jgi:hypothetical protein
MRRLLIVSLPVALGWGALPVIGVPAQAAKHAVSCTAEPGCATACSSNTYVVACYATVRNGRCYKWCGRKP